MPLPLHHALSAQPCKSALLGLLTAAVLTWSPAAAAQPNADSAEDVIDELFATAQADFGEKRYEEALEKLTRIYAVEPDSIIRYNIARCYEELGRLQEAEQEFEAALADPNLPAELRTEAKSRLTSVRTQRTPPPDQPDTTDLVPPPTPAPHVSVLFVPHFLIAAPGILNDFDGVSPAIGFEIGYVVPLDVVSFVRPVTITFDVLVTAPVAKGDAPQTHGVPVEWELEQRTLFFELASVWRFMPVDRWLSAYCQVGGRVYLVESTLKPTAGAAEMEERSTVLGALGAVGLDLRAGPGSLFLAIEAAVAEVDQELTGPASIGGIGADLGYRFHF